MSPTSRPLALAALLCLAAPVVAATHGARFTLDPKLTRAQIDVARGPSVSVEDGAAWIRGTGGRSFEASLRTTSIGRVGNELAVTSGETAFDAGIVEIARDGVVEWFAAGERGVEHGWTIAEPPAGRGAVWIGLELRGDLSMRIAADGLSALFVDPRGAPAASYTELIAFDAGGRPLEARLESSPTGAGIRVDDEGAAYPITVDPWIGSPAWSYTGLTAGGSVGTSLRGAGDVNNDGYSDVVIGGVSVVMGGVGSVVRVFLGGPGGLSTAPAVTIPDPAGNSQFGQAVSCAGDVNGDGYDDIIVGAPGHDGAQSNLGKVYVFPGTSSGVATAPIYTWQPAGYFAGGSPSRAGHSVTYLGDLNGDGFDEFAFGVPYDNPTSGPIDNAGSVRVVFGGSFSMSTLPSQWAGVAGFGHAIVNGGNTNGEGPVELFVSAIDYDTTPGFSQAGLVMRCQLDASGAATAWDGWDVGSYNYRCGWSLGSGGDFNGDGRTDLISSEPAYSANEGRITVFGGLAPGGTFAYTTLMTALGTSAAEMAGWSVACAGDVNGDGFADMLVGAPKADVGGLDDSGRAYLYLGGASLAGSQPALTLDGTQLGGNFGFCVAAAGDVNGDGFGDFLVGEPYFDGAQVDAGRVHLVYGHSTEPSPVAWTREESSVSPSRLGASVTWVGDVNGDGYDDVAAGSPDWSGGQSGEGRVQVFAGGPTGLGASPLSSVESNVQNAHLGFSIAGVGDLDGDGYGDLAAGAVDYTNGQTAEGAVFVYRGSSSGLITTPAWILESNVAFVHFGERVAHAGDLNNDGFSDFAVGCPSCSASEPDEGTVTVYYGSPFGPLYITPQVLRGGYSGSNFGSGLAGGLRLNADGYDDLVVGAPDFSNGEPGEGIVRVYRGSAAGVLITPIQTIEGDAPNIHWGYRLAGIGDTNGDGYCDVAIGCPDCASSAPGEGEVWVYRGSAAGLVAPIAIAGGQNFGHFGAAVSGAGDVNADGYADLVVGALDFDDGGTWDTGRVNVHLGSASGIATSAAWTYVGDQFLGNVGASVSGAGDVNGDGFADLVFGAPNYDTASGADGGKVFAALGNVVGHNGDFRSGARLRPQQTRHDGSRSIALDASTHHYNQFRSYASIGGAVANTSTPAGRVKARVAFQFATQGAAFTTTTFVPFAPIDSGPTGLAPTPQFATQVIGTDPLGAKWRVRLAIDDPFLPRTPWVTVSGRASSQSFVHDPSNCDADLVVDHVEVAAGAVDLNHDLVPDDCVIAGTGYCTGQAAGACPCGNSGAAGRGCASSVSAAGAWLRATGNASVSADSVVLLATDMPNSSALYYQGTSNVNGGAGSFFGDGLRCVQSNVIRLGTKTNASGGSQYPSAGDASVSVRGALPIPGGSRYYQVWYRNSAAFCTAATFNLSNGLRIDWQP